MKQWKKTLLLMAAAVTLTAAGGGAAGAELAAAGFNEEALKTDAQETATDLVNGDYEAVEVKFDEAMSAQLDLENLQASWEAATKDLGDYIGQVSVKGVESSGYYIVSVLEHFENNGLNVRLVYDTESRIAGMQCTYAAVGEEEPEADASYTQEKMTVTADPDFPLDGILTLPKDVEKPPVVILVQGSGTTDKNEEISGNKPFQDIAWGLAEQGIATLRYDKRYFAKPEAAPELSKMNLRLEMLDDLAAAITLMESDERVDNQQVFVLGHSLGGLMAPAIAVEHPELSGVISMAGTLRPLWEVSYDQAAEAFAALDETTLSEEEKTAVEEQKAQMAKDFDTLRAGFSDLPDDTVLAGIPVGYWKSMDEYQGMNFIDEVTMPMLILQGDADFQVYPDKDYTLWEDTIGDRDNVVFHLYEGLNHLMMPTQGKRDASEYQVKSHVDPQVISDIAEFIKTY
ncbi:MAG: alpha/beta fold hydrolase [Lachnospiraceae bacterium]|nr:alpha/beta fold hydrolase [Lachnospiraceae bacterium]